VLRNDCVGAWRGRKAELKQAKAVQIPRYRDASKTGDATVAATFVGEAVGLIHAIEPAAILERIVAEAERLLGGAARYISLT
jgi:nitronate monooxygenase